uniref:Uncharacterized protein n=1 Tax=Arundo donax TaxID=35708 RepID=A0A0A9GRW5_ARUDO
MLPPSYESWASSKALRHPSLCLSCMYRLSIRTFACLCQGGSSGLGDTVGSHVLEAVSLE